MEERRRTIGKDDRAGIRERLQEEAKRECSGGGDRVGWAYLFWLKLRRSNMF